MQYIHIQVHHIQIQNVLCGRTLKALVVKPWDTNSRSCWAIKVIFFVSLAQKKKKLVSRSSLTVLSIHAHTNCVRTNCVRTNCVRVCIIYNQIVIILLSAAEVFLGCSGLMGSLQFVASSSAGFHNTVAFVLHNQMGRLVTINKSLVVLAIRLYTYYIYLFKRNTWANATYSRIMYSSLS